MPKICWPKSETIQPAVSPNGAVLMWRVKRSFGLAQGRSVAILLTALLPGCVTANNQRPETPRPDIISQIREVDLQPRFPHEVKSPQTTTRDPERQAVTYNGDGSSGLAQYKGSNAATSAQASTDPVTTGTVGDPR